MHWSHWLGLGINAGGVVSIVPWHYTRTFIERLALIFNFLGVFAFTSPFEKRNPKKGLYGSCILTTREDYENIKGHESIKSEMLDDLNLGAAYKKAGIQVNNFLGYGLFPSECIHKGSKAGFKASAKGPSRHVHLESGHHSPYCDLGYRTDCFRNFFSFL